ncbi:hypothetical protein Tco_0512530 [Tanacetum coccineum]
MTKSLHIINPGNYDVPDLIITIPHNLCNMIITKSESTKKFFYIVDELRALSGHVLRASRVQVLEDDLDDMHWTREEDGKFETANPQFVLSSKMLEGLDPKMLGSSLKLTDFETLVLLRYTLTFGLGVVTGVWLVSLEGTIGLEVILVIGHFVLLIVKVLPVGGTSMVLFFLLLLAAGVILFFHVLFFDCDLLALVEGITPVKDNKGSLLSDAFFLYSVAMCALNLLIEDSLACN